MNVATITIILQLLPLIINAIKVIEEAIPDGNEGEKKLIAVRNILEAADSGITNMWPAIEKVIKTLVVLFNGTIWKK